MISERGDTEDEHFPGIFPISKPNVLFMLYKRSEPTEPFSMSELFSLSGIKKIETNNILNYTSHENITTEQLI